ncbi:MAG: hypothetical protein ACHRXM_34450 [Isosphaerales bacterium]
MPSLVVIAISSLVWVALDRQGMALWVGGYPLKVYLVPPDDRKIVKVSYALVRRKQDAEYLRNVWAEDPQIDPLRLDFALKSISWTEGQPFAVYVNCHGATLRSGRELSYSQDRVLILRLQYEDHPGQYIAVDIPDGHSQRQVSVSP